jgi:hypothetical protein
MQQMSYTRAIDFILWESKLGSTELFVEGIERVFRPRIGVRSFHCGAVAGKSAALDPRSLALKHSLLLLDVLARDGSFETDLVLTAISEIYGQRRTTDSGPQVGRGCSMDKIAQDDELTTPDLSVIIQSHPSISYPWEIHNEFCLKYAGNTSVHSEPKPILYDFTVLLPGTRVRLSSRRFRSICDQRHKLLLLLSWFPL